jgi:probable F420-dependent oxidoreductase
MEIGVRIPHVGASASPELVREWCQVADQAGFGVLWGVDHVVMPRHVRSKYLLTREPITIAEGALSAQLAPNFELTATLAFVAAITERIKIATGVAVLTIRNALLNARQLATVDRYSGGRLLYGVGIGWLEEEAAAMNMAWDHRGARVDEHIELLRTIWTAAGPYVEFYGEYWTVPSMDPEPRPVQRPIPILIGGHSPSAMDRAARLGDGWIAAGVSPGRLTELLALREVACERHDRDPVTLPVYCRAGQGQASLDDLHRYAELDVRSVQVNIDSLDELNRFADEVLPSFR